MTKATVTYEHDIAKRDPVIGELTSLLEGQDAVRWNINEALPDAHVSGFIELSGPYEDYNNLVRKMRNIEGLKVRPMVVGNEIAPEIAGIRAMILIGTAPATEHEVYNKLEELPYVTQVSPLFSEKYDLMVCANAKDGADLDRILKVMGGIKGVISTKDYPIIKLKG